MFKRFWWVFLVMVVACPLLGLLISATVTYVMPKKYESVATIQFRSDAVGGLSLEDSGFRTMSEHIQAMKSDEVLLKVSENLQLPNKWGYERTEVVQQLRKVIRIEPRRGTDLLDVRAHYTNKEDARDIAAELIHAYRFELMQLDRSKPEHERRVSKLKAVILEKEKVMEQRKKDLQDASMSLRNKPVAGGAEDQLHLVRQREYVAAENNWSYARMELSKYVEASKFIEPIVVSSLIIHQDSVISTVPVSPNVPLNLLSGILGGLVLSPLLSLPLIWLLHSAFRKKSVLPV